MKVFPVTVGHTSAGEPQRMGAAFWTERGMDVLGSRVRAENLHLGCGVDRQEFALGVDILPNVKPDVVCDCDVDGRRLHLPFRDNSFRCVFSHMFLEHIRDLMGLADECWRVLKPGGIFEAHIPWWSSYRTWGDPTHVRAFGPQSMSFWCHDKYRQAVVEGRPMTQMQRFADFEVMHTILILPKHLEGKGVEELDYMVEHLTNVVNSLWVRLRCIKEG